MEKHFLVFWGGRLHEDDPHNHANIVKVLHPPHDEPRGSILEEMLTDALIRGGHHVVYIYGAVELQSAAWASGVCREVIVGDGRVGTVECTGGEWRVTL